ncbi:PTS transporter subunit EIIA [Vibrio sp. S17_S38]|uniref:PTS sugar transporter subunit IIA n=1 Tax=Vibrio sp. S17_S38 TaxID=2720229 RepID=UPI0016815CE3|nr:PTS sugar transporter subunit IIA [Vibrio sp. S17_S38]MBD1573514.1 PTS transporter subunit EIIA [Vibrio sp. S17_S38]
MSTVRVTFYLGQAGLPAWLIKGVHHQVRGFKGYAELIKVQTLQRVNVQKYLSALTFAFQPFDLCQIVLTGEHAASYAAILRIYLHKDCFLLDKRITPTSQDTQHLHLSHFEFHHVTIQKQFDAFIRLYRLMHPSENESAAEKAYILQQVAKISSIENYKVIAEQLNRREQSSSTGMKGGIALPHIMTEYVNQPQLICLTSNNPIDWQSSHGPVTHIIALLLPKESSKNTMYAVRHLAVSLLSLEVNQFVSEHHTSNELHAILTCLMMPKV